MNVLKISAAIAICSAAYYNYMIMRDKKTIKKQWKKRRWWMSAIHRNRTSKTMGNQITEMIYEPICEIHKFLRMSLEDFEYIMSKEELSISKSDTPFREAVPAKIRLMVTLRFLATGDSYESPHFLFKISHQLISQIIPQVCVAINKSFKDEIRMPSSSEEWLKIEDGFKDKISTVHRGNGWKAYCFKMSSKFGF